MIRISVFLISVFLLAAPAFAAEPFECVSDGAIEPAQARTLLSRVQAAYKKVDGFRARFHQSSYLAALDLSEGSSGFVSFANPGRMKWHYTAPEEQYFVVRDQTLWFYQVEDQQVLIDNLEGVFRSDLPVSFLMGIGDLSEAFSVSSACRTEKGIRFDLKPKSAGQNSEDQDLREFVLLADAKHHLPAGAIVVDAAGNRNTFVFSEPDTTPDFDEQTFAVKWPKGTDVQDRRASASRGAAHQGERG